MKRKGTKILIVMCTFLMIFQTIVLATNPFDEIKPVKPDDDTITQMNDFRNKLYTVFQLVGTGIAVISLIVLGIKYISSSPNERADIKKYAIIYVISAVVFFGAIGIVEILKGFGLEVLK